MLLLWTKSCRLEYQSVSKGLAHSSPCVFPHKCKGFSNSTKQNFCWHLFYKYTHFTICCQFACTCLLTLESI
uniref:Uncharacterized protein n=1 Tax=Anguilla anguilla TaxID=7936 RepID=A0A0E9VVK5_ANGAN